MGGIFSWEVTYLHDIRTANVLWLVVSDGPAPTGSNQRYAILYVDRDTKRVSAYEYDVEKKEHSWMNREGAHPIRNPRNS